MIVERKEFHGRMFTSSLEECNEFIENKQITRGNLINIQEKENTIIIFYWK